MEGTEDEWEFAIRSLRLVILCEEEEEGLPEREGFAVEERGRGVTSFSSSSAKLRSLGGFLGLAEEEEEGLVAAEEVVSSLSGSVSPPRRRKLRDLAEDMAVGGGEWRKWKFGGLRL